MKRLIIKFLSLSLILILIFTCLTGCGKKMTLEKAMEEVNAVQIRIDKGFDYLEMTRFSYNSDGEKTGKEVYLLHAKEDKFYVASYSIELVENSGTDDKVYIEVETLEQEILIKKQENEEKYISIEHIKETSEIEKTIKIDEISKEKYDERKTNLYSIVFNKLLPETQDQLFEESLATGTLVTSIKFKVSEEIPEINLTINKLTHKIHSAIIYFNDGSKIDYSFNYPMIGGTIAKTEIPTIV